MPDNILHTTSVRMRVRGTGNLDMKLRALVEPEDVDPPVEVSLLPVVMVAGTPRAVNTLANFESQYTQLEITTDEIDEYFRIDKVTIYVKEVATSYPQ